jgi:hypothetical protein
MPDSNTAKAREFLRRYQHLSQHSGYNLVYDTLALIDSNSHYDPKLPYFGF